ncbi:sodium-coupled monocarboxylate transporter 1-like [Macrosteles quadrilineatus]|uniref:sodium-coupled monocarboxylate transporter 1-like n=1 Tax=Macrosteles quadrilineatus TaxID=74068 RepID=UPI0023E1151E|nr:sodium-coupled monocarboxylate transporter 1-like [Macrosteles quadrilineatus]
MERQETDLGSAVLMFNWIEYLVFGTMLLLSLLIGVYFGWIKKQDTVAEYLLGGKKMGVFPVTISLVASHISGITLLGVPSEVYAYGTQYVAIFITIVCVYLIIYYLYLPVFFHLQLNSAYEYLELRFSKGTRTLGSLIFSISLIIFIPIVIYVPALAFNQVTGVSVHLISLITSLICIFYTLFGGLKAVVWTDTLQGMFTLTAMSLILILGYLKIGSFHEIWRINQEGSRLELFNLNPSPFERNTIWTVSIGSTFAWLSSIGIHPGALQRFIAVATLKEAKRVIAWGCVGFAVVQALTIPMGLLLYAYYHDCDPLATKMIRKTSQILPYYVMDVARDFPGLTGLFISGVLSAALSTMSAGLNTVAGTLYEDFVQFVLKGEKLSEASQSLILKVIVLVLGLVCNQPNYKCCLFCPQHDVRWSQHSSCTMSAGLNTVAGTLYEDFVQFVLKGEKLSEASQSLILKVIVLVLACTMSAGLNTVAGTLYEDFVQFVLKGEKLSEASQSLILKVIVLVLACTMSAGLNTVAGTLYEDFVQFVLKGEKLSEASQSLILKVIVLVLACTMSAGLNTVAGTLYEDFVQFVLKGEKLSEASQSLILKVIVLVLGLLCVALVFIVEKLGALFQMAISLQGISTGALLGLFSLGLLFPRANAKGAIAGALSSLLGMAVIIVGAQWYIMEKQLRFPGKVTSVDGCPEDLIASLGFNASANAQTWTGLGTPVEADDSVPIIFKISYMYYCMVGTLIVIVVGLLVSYLTTPQDLLSLDPNLFSPPVRRFLPQRGRDQPAKEEYTLVNTDPAGKDGQYVQDSQTTGA